MAWSPGVWVNLWQRYFGNMLNIAASSGLDSEGTPMLSATGSVVLLWAGPLLAVAFVVAVGSTLAQGVPTFAIEALAPNFNKLNPVKNLQQLFLLAGVGPGRAAVVSAT